MNKRANARLRPNMTSARSRALVFAYLGATVALSGCVTSGSNLLSAQAGLRCVDDSGACIAARRRALIALRADQSRDWVNKPFDARTYAAGVRLFAFRLEKASLTCPQLVAGVREADQAPALLRSAQSKSLTPAQISRGLMLSAEVGKELAKEHARRCSR